MLELNIEENDFTDASEINIDNVSQKIDDMQVDEYDDEIEVYSARQ